MTRTDIVVQEQVLDCSSKCQGRRSNSGRFSAQPGRSIRTASYCFVLSETLGRAHAGSILCPSDCAAAVGGMLFDCLRENSWSEGGCWNMRNRIHVWREINSQHETGICHGGSS